MIEKFRVYVNKFCADDENCGGVVADVNGEFFKVDTILNNMQQLNIDILALRKDDVVADDMYWVGWNMAIELAAGMLKLFNNK
jgi:hypothetical protein